VITGVHILQLSEYWIISIGIAGYVSVCVQLYCMLVSTVFGYMFRSTLPSSGVYDSSTTRTKTAQEQNTNGKNAECDHVKKGSEPKKQRSRVLKYMKINI
jgi:hypothetical protein